MFGFFYLFSALGFLARKRLLLTGFTVSCHTGKDKERLAV